MRIFSNLAALLGLAIFLSACSTLDIASHEELQRVKAQTDENTTQIAANAEAIAGLIGKINQGNRHLFDRICSKSGDGYATRNLLQKQMKAAGGELKKAAKNPIVMEQVRILACMGINSEGSFREEAYLYGGKVLVEVTGHIISTGRQVKVMVKDGGTAVAKATLTGKRNGNWAVN